MIYLKLKKIFDISDHFCLGCQVDKPIEVQSNVITITNFKDLLSQDNSIERSNKCDRLSNEFHGKRTFSFK